jgi:hypothetical protein
MVISGIPLLTRILRDGCPQQAVHCRLAHQLRVRRGPFETHVAQLGTGYHVPGADEILDFGERCRGTVELHKVTIFKVMAPHVCASIIAQEHKLDPPLTTLTVGIGTPLSFLILWSWCYVLQAVRACGKAS